MSILQGLCSYGGRLYAAWKGEVGDDRLFYSSFDGTGWTGSTALGGNSSVGPELATFGASMFAAWKGEHSDERLFYSALTGTTWSASALIPGAGSVGPSLAAFDGQLYAAWKGNSADQRLWYASFDGTSWSGQALIPGVASSVGPSLATFDGRLYAAWKGAGNDQRLWYASFDGTSWSEQASIPGNTGQDLPQNIGLRMQYQETHNWCWIAVATSINYFYNPTSTATQCGIMTVVGQTVNGFPSNTSACPSAQAVATVPGLAAILADPYLSDAENALDNPALGIPPVYIKTGGVGDALNVHGNWNKTGPSSPTLAQIASEIDAGRPVAVDIAWYGGAGHCVAIAGVLDDQLYICDPANGESVIGFELFPAAYHGGATLVSMQFTQKGT